MQWYTRKVKTPELWRLESVAADSNNPFELELDVVSDA
jgi:hypothetical protein